MRSKMSALLLAAFATLFFTFGEMSVAQRQPRTRKFPVTEAQVIAKPSVIPLNSLSSSSPTRSLTFRYDGQVLASGHADGTVRLWKASDGTLLRTFHDHTKAVTAIAFSPNGDLLATGGEDKAIAIEQANEGRLLRNLKGIKQECFMDGGDFAFADSIKSLVFSPAGTLLAFSGSCATAVWQVKDWSILRVFEVGALKGSDSLIFVQDSQMLLEGNKLFRVSDGTLIRTLKCSGHSLSFSASQGVTASGDSGRAQLCDLKDGRLMRELPAAPKKSYDLGSEAEVVFIPSGRMLITASSGAWRDKGWETTIRFWDVGTWQMTYNQIVPLMDTMALAVSPDGRMLAAGGYLYPSSDEGGVIRVWQISDGEAVRSGDTSELH